MLLQKKFRVFRKSWKGCAALCLVLTGLMAVMELDLTGFERRTPDPDRVVSAYLSCGSIAPYDSGDPAHLHQRPGLIQEIVDLHQAIVTNRPSRRTGRGATATRP